MCSDIRQPRVQRIPPEIRTAISSTLHPRTNARRTVVQLVSGESQSYYPHQNGIIGTIQSVEQSAVTDALGKQLHNFNVPEILNLCFSKVIYWIVIIIVFFMVDIVFI